MTKKGYWMAMVEVSDPEAYKRYIAANAVAFEKYGARFLIRGGRHEDPEGATGDRLVVIEFELYDTALACYHSPEYAEALKLRRAAATSRLAIVEGV